MSNSTKQQVGVDDVDLPTIVELNRLGFGFSKDQSFELSSLVDSDIQVRAVEHRSPKDTVVKFAAQLPHKVFPSIVVTKDGVLIDGYTRKEAHVLLNETICSALILDETWAEASEKRQKEMRQLGFSLNSTAGKGLEPDEIRKGVRNAVDLGYTDDQIARSLGATSRIIKAVRKEMLAEERLNGLGVQTNGNTKLTEPVLRALGTEAIVVMNDTPFAALATLAADAGLGVREIQTLGKEAREAGSDEDAVSVLSKARTDMVSRIRERELNPKKGPAASGRLRQRLGWINKWVGAERELVETATSSATAHTEDLEKAIKVLTKTLELQKDRLPKEDATS